MDIAAILNTALPFRSWWPQVTRRTLRPDLLAGLTGAVIVLPQGVAFAIIAGLPPEYGLYTAIVPAIIASLFGSSFHLVSGPTTAISIVLFTTVSPHAAAGSEAYFARAEFFRGAYRSHPSCPVSACSRPTVNRKNMMRK